MCAWFRVERLAQGSAGHGCWRDGSRLAPRACGGTTHGWRVYRQGDGEGRAPRDGVLRPRNLSGPAGQLPQRRGGTCSGARALQVRVRGRPPSPSVPFACWIGASAGVHAHAPGRGPGPLGSCACVDARGASGQRPVARLAHRDPGRPPARLRPARPAGDSGRDRTPRLVSPEPRRRGPAEAPRPSRPGPCRVVSLRGPEMLGPQDGGGGSIPPRRRRPTGDPHGRSSCRRCPHGYPPRPWRMGPGGRRTPPPGPAGRGCSPASRRAAPPATSCRGRGPIGAGIRSVRPAAWPSARSSMRPRGVTGHRSHSGRGRLPHPWARPDGDTARRLRGGSLWRRASAQAQAGGPASWAAARGSGVPHVDASEASGAGAAHESPASPRERHRPGGASHRAAARRFFGPRACRGWRGPHGWPAESGQAPAPRACRRERRGRPATPRSSGLRRRRPDPSGRARWS